MKHAFLWLMILIVLQVLVVLMINPPADIAGFVSGRLEGSQINWTGLMALIILGLCLIAAYFLLRNLLPSMKNRIWIPLGWIWELALLILCYGGTSELTDKLLTHFAFSLVMGIGLWIMLKQQSDSSQNQ